MSELTHIKTSDYHDLLLQIGRIGGACEMLLAERDRLRERVAALEKRRDELDAGWDKAVAEVLLLRAVVAAADAMLENMHEWPAGLYAYNTARAALEGKL